ncbi:PHD finger protein 23A-like [Lineus longissimus]|uniref:PHD finger protein 23A-like n=1 Tax=Lineus longissimus TaxID=88925 RepID=UPI002B4C5F0B
MTEDVFKAPKAKKSHHKDEHEAWSPKAKRRRTKDDFFSFCNIVLTYTQYEAEKQEEERVRHNSSPLDSGGSTAESFTSDTTLSDSASSSMTGYPEESVSYETPRRYSRQKSNPALQAGVDEDSPDLITCFCLKPYAGRPMIECSDCLSWIHLSCAKIRKNNIPDDFICQACRDIAQTKRKSQRHRVGSKRLST